MPVGALFGAVLSGISLASGFSLAAGLMFAGSAMSFVGQITGNDKLAKIGSIVGLAGGVTSLVQNFGKVAEAVGSSAAASAEATSGAASTAGNTIKDALVAPPSIIEGGAVGEALQSASPVLTEGAGGGIISGNMGDALKLGDLGSGLYDLSISSGSPVGFAVGEGASAAANAAKSAGNLNWTDIGKQTGNGSLTLGDVWDTGKKAVSSFADWAKENKELIEVGSKVLMGVGDSLTKQEAAKIYANAQLAAQQGQYERADEEMRRFSESIKNLQQQNPVQQVDLYKDSNRAWIPGHTINQQGV
jgi:hypothetical protein